MKRLALGKVFSHTFVGVLACSIGTSATVAAAIAGGVITACENVATGVLRVETATAPCVVAGSPMAARAPLLVEQRITWNQTGQPGPTGATGPQGAAGVAGPKGEPGPGLTWRGAYQSTQSYAINDAVQSLGSAYVATAAVTALSCTGACVDTNAPGLNSAWQLLAAAGAIGDAGAMGPAGDTGPQGPAGPPGPGISGYEIVDTGSLAVPGLQASQGVATCSPGKRVLGGGVVGSPFLMSIYKSIPDNSWDAWIGAVYNADVVSVHYHVYAICVAF